MAQQKAIKLLLIEDNPDHAELTIRALGESLQGASITPVDNAEEALQQLESRLFDVALVDYSLPRTDGLGFLRDLRNRRIRVPVLLISGHGGEEVAAEAMRLGAFDFLAKSKGYLRALPMAIENALMAASQQNYEARNESFLENVEAAGEAIYMQDLMGHIIYVNRQAELLTGYQRTELLGKHYSVFLPESKRELVSQTLRSREYFHGTSLTAAIQHKDRRQIPVKVFYLPMRMDGRLFGYQALVQPLQAGSAPPVPQAQAKNRIKTVVTELRRRKAKLKKMQKYQNELFYQLSHEFRTPLNGIIGYCEILQCHTYGELTDEQAVAVNNIAKCGQQLLDLVDEYLNVPHENQHPSGRLKVKVAPAELLQAALAPVWSMAARQHVEIRLDCAPDLPAVHVEFEQMSRVIAELARLLIGRERDRLQIICHQQKDDIYVAFGASPPAVAAGHDAAAVAVPDAQPQDKTVWRYVKYIVDVHEGSLTLAGDAPGTRQIILRLPVAVSMDETQELKPIQT